MALAAETYTAAELARTMGVTPATITNWKADGCPYRQMSGRPVYVLKDVIDWRLAQARAASAPLDKEAEQVRKLKAEADRVEIDVAKARAVLVPHTAMEEALAEEHDALRAALVSLPSRFARVVVDRTGCSMATAQTLLADIADATLTDLQGGADADGE